MPNEDTAALPIYAMPGHVIRRLQQVAVSLFVEEMEGAGIELTAVQFAALVAIDAYPLIDQSTLGKIIAYDRTTIGGVIDRLEDRGLVRRVVTRENKRIRQLVIEPSGQELLGRSRPVAERVQERLLDPLTGPERDAFMTLSGKILDAYNDLSRAPLRPMKRR